MVLSGTSDVGAGHRGIYVDDARYGRVLVSWDALDRVDFDAMGELAGPAYDAFTRGGPLMGVVTTRAGRRIAGRLVFDLDESQVTETLDAPYRGVDYTIPFGRVASIVLPPPGERAVEHARVLLHGGEELRLEHRGDLGDGNAGILVFVDGGEATAYVPWREVEQVELELPPAVTVSSGR